MVQPWGRSVRRAPLCGQIDYARALRCRCPSRCSVASPKNINRTFELFARAGRYGDKDILVLQRKIRDVVASGDLAEPRKSGSQLLECVNNFWKKAWREELSGDGVLLAIDLLGRTNIELVPHARLSWPHRLCPQTSITLCMIVCTLPERSSMATSIRMTGQARVNSSITFSIPSFSVVMCPA